MTSAAELFGVPEGKENASCAASQLMGHIFVEIWRDGAMRQMLKTCDTLVAMQRTRSQGYIFSAYDYQHARWDYRDRIRAKVYRRTRRRAFRFQKVRLVRRTNSARQSP